MPTLRQLRYLVAVVDEGSFTDAAAEVGVTQPGLSHQIGSLERELGGRLVERSVRGAVPTPLGREVLPHARSALGAAARLSATAARVNDGTTGSIAVATITSLSLGVLPDVLRRWRMGRPGVRVAVHEHLSVDALGEAMTHGVGDVGLGPLPPGWRGPVQPVGTERFVVLLPPGHRLRRRARIRLAELAEDEWVQYAPEHGLAGVLDHLAATAGFVPRVALRTHQTAAAPRFTAAGVGPCLVLSNIVPPEADVTSVELRPPVTRDIVAFTRDRPDPLVAEFVELLRAEADLG